jgi:hypothetical protein
MKNWPGDSRAQFSYWHVCDMPTASSDVRY